MLFLASSSERKCYCTDDINLLRYDAVSGGRFYIQAEYIHFNVCSGIRKRPSSPLTPQPDFLAAGRRQSIVRGHSKLGFSLIIYILGGLKL